MKRDRLVLAVSENQVAPRRAATPACSLRTARSDM